MAKIVINGFQGMRPRVSPTLLPATAAEQADNCNLVRGSVKSFRAPRESALLVNEGVIGTIYLYRESNGTERWLEWNEDVDVQPGPIAGDTARRAYFTGTDYPRVFDESMVNAGAGATYPKSSFRMGVARPTTPIVAAPGAGGTGEVRTVNYVYTNVRRWASGKVDQGPPSPPSNDVDVLDGQVVDLSGFDNPDPEYGITHRWIYRLETGTQGAEYQFLAEIAVADSTYQDTTTIDAIGVDILPSEEWVEPPDDLKGLISLPNGCFAGFVGKQVCVSYPYQVHAWPVRYRLTLPFEIVALGHIGTTIVAATMGPAYVIDAQDPEVMSPNQVGEIYPCLSKRGLVSADNLVIYPTHDGLAFVSQGGATGLLTQKLVSTEEWKAFNPRTIRAAAYRGMYFAFYHSSGDTEAVPDSGFNLSYVEPEIGISLFVSSVHALYSDPEKGRLYFAQTDEVQNVNKVYDFDSRSDRVPYLWRSKIYVAPAEVHFGAARLLGDLENALTIDEEAQYEQDRQDVIAQNQDLIDADEDSGALNGSALNEEEVNGDALLEVPPPFDDIVGVIFTLIANGKSVASVPVNSEEPFRLPSGWRGRTFQVQLQGQVEVRQVIVAPSIEEIADAA
ncbi:MAG TPA: hypothetical protein VF193_14100 [Steroidobacter sp.]